QLLHLGRDGRLREVQLFGRAREAAEARARFEHLELGQHAVSEVAPDVGAGHTQDSFAVRQRSRPPSLRRARAAGARRPGLTNRAVRPRLAVEATLALRIDGLQAADPQPL